MTLAPDGVCVQPLCRLAHLNPNFPNYMSVSRRKFVSTAGAAVALTAIGSRAEALGTSPPIKARDFNFTSASDAV